MKFERIEKDGKRYVLVPEHRWKRQTRAVNALKESLRNALLYPELNCAYPIDTLLFAVRTLLGDKWNELSILLKSEILQSLDDVPREDMEESERPYTIKEYFEKVLPNYMSDELVEDFFGGDI